MEPIQLVEYQDWTGTLMEDDARYIRRELATYVQYRVELGDDRLLTILNPHQFVGVAVLPSGRRLESRPKVPLANLFYMLALVHQIPFREDEAAFDRLDELLELIARHFAGLVEERLAQGLYRAYVEQEENLIGVRGRIDFTADLRQNYLLRHRTSCRYGDLTWDVPENQVLRQVARLLSGWDFTVPTRLRLARLDAQLAEVQTGRLTAADIDRFVYHRLNEGYQPLHALCRLFLEGASLSEAEGTLPLRSFFVDMNKLFESFVTRVLAQHAPLPYRVMSQSQLHLDTGRTVTMRPDILIYERDRVVFAADCKYKRLESGGFRHPDLYQILAYCTATGIGRGALIYPVHMVAFSREFQIERTAIYIHEITLDLGGDLPGLKAHRTRFASAFFGRIR